MNRPPFHYCGSSNGSVFIVTLVVSLGLVTMALFFGQAMLMAYRGSDNELAGRQADQATEGAARYAEYLMSIVDNPGDMPDPTTYQSEAVAIGDATFWFIGEPTSSDPVDQPVFRLVDEASKLNLNTAPVEIIQLLPGMTADLAASIVAWRKTASDTTTASSSINFSTTPIKNAPFETVPELALITGTNQAYLYGEDANLNHVLEPNEDDGDKTLPPDNSNGKLDPGLLEYFTIFSRESNKRSDGTQRINVTRTSPQLRTLLTGTLGTARGNEIMGKIGMPSTIRSVIEFYNRTGMTETEFASLSADLTVKDGEYLTGLINVNTASETVLACIPGIGDKASQLVATRQSQTQLSTNLAWIVPVLGVQGANQAGPYLTTRTYQVSADVAAVGHHGRGYRRTQFVIDSSTGTPRIVYRRNLTSLGWALGSNAREVLTTNETLQ